MAQPQVDALFTVDPDLTAEAETMTGFAHHLLTAENRR